MRVLVAGASGAIGRPLIELLGETGHEPVALVHRTPPDTSVAAVSADALDRDAILAAVREANPDAVVNLLTAIPRELSPRRFEAQFEPTNRLRREGTANLVAAAPGSRFISESVAFGYSPAGGPLAGEDRPLWFDGPAPFRPAALALAELEGRTVDARGLVLRFGHLYGPGTSFAADGAVAERVRARQMPIVGDGSGRFSFVHVHDAATAIIAALEKPDVRGVLNIVDDEPLAAATWLPRYAEALGARPPRRVPEWLARIAAGPWGVAYMNRLVGASNARARLELDWRPRYPSLADGLRDDLALVRT